MSFYSQIVFWREVLHKLLMLFSDLLLNFELVHSCKGYAFATFPLNAEGMAVVREIDFQYSFF